MKIIFLSISLLYSIVNYSQQTYEFISTRNIQVYVDTTFEEVKETVRFYIQEGTNGNNLDIYYPGGKISMGIMEYDRNKELIEILTDHALYKFYLIRNKIDKVSEFPNVGCREIIYLEQPHTKKM